MHAPLPADYSDYPWIAPFPDTPDGGGAFGWRPRACLRYTLQAVDKSRHAHAQQRNHSIGALAAANLSNSHQRFAGVSFEDFVDSSMNVEMESAKHLLSTLLDFANTAPTCTQDPLCVRATAVLTQWDGLCAAESTGALLYERFRRDFLSASSEWQVPFDLSDPIETPSGIPSTAAELAVSTLARVAREMEEEDSQPLDLPWGAYKRLPIDNNGVEWGLSGSVGDSVRTSGGEAARPSAGATTSTGVAGGTYLLTIVITAQIVLACHSIARVGVCVRACARVYVPNQSFGMLIAVSTRDRYFQECQRVFAGWRHLGPCPGADSIRQPVHAWGAA